MPANSTYFSDAINSLTVGYILALAFIGAIAAAAHIVTGLVINAQASNAAIVNVSGRQRMLSQRIAMLANHWVQASEPSDKDKLVETTDLFELSHNSLIAGRINDTEYKLSEAARAIIFESPYRLDQQVRNFIVLARIASTMGEAAEVATEELTVLATAAGANQIALMAGLNQLVLAFQEQHEQQIHQMRFVQNIALIVLVLALAAEAILIFRPLVKRVSVMADSLNTAAITDPMTEVNNRRGFMLRGETLATQRQESAVVILDIDNFKSINDAYGHAAGDACIIHAATLAQRVFRDGDVFGRIGGEEFAAVLHSISRNKAIEVANRLRETVASSPCSLSGINCEANEIKFTVSIGVCAFSQPTPLTDLMQDADAALYEAKNSGRNRVCASASPIVTPISARASR